MLLAFGFGGVIAEYAVAQIQFDDQHLIPTTTGVGAVTALSLNADGNRDIALCEYSESVRAYLNRGDGQFELAGSVFEPGYALSFLRSGDFDGDGVDDLVWSGQINDQMLLQIRYSQSAMHQTGMVTIPLSLSLPVQGLVVGDLVGTGRPDVAIVQANLVTVFENHQGRLSVASAWALPYDESRDLAVGDLDGDGDLDLAVSHADALFDRYYGWKVYATEVHVLLNDGEGSFNLRYRIGLPYGGGEYDVPMPLGLELIDLDGDSDEDIAVVANEPNYSSSIEVLLIENRDFGNSFNIHDRLVFGESRMRAAITAGDFDMDGDIDLVASGQERQAALVENLGDFQFELQLLDADIGRSSNKPIADDFDGDGRLDLAFGVFEGLSLLLNTTAYDGPVLEHTPLKRGSQSTLTVTDAQPGERVDFLYTFHGTGNSVGIQQLGGITLDLNDEIRQLGHTTADGSGTAEFHFSVPSDAPLREVVMQAVIRRGPGGEDSVKTPFRTARIGE